MSKLRTLIIALAFTSQCKAQQFQFQMQFVDALGFNSITLGYDSAATDSIDPTFGESNILTGAYILGLDVRAGNVWLQQNFNSGIMGVPGIFGQTSFETKKQILPNVCGTSNFWNIVPIAEINIVGGTFPMKVYWDKSLFNDACRNGSVLTDVHPGGWWDTGGFIQLLNASDSMTLYPSQFSYMTSGNIFVNVYFLAITDSTLFTSGMSELNSDHQTISVYPNPAFDYLTLKADQSFGKVDFVSFYNIVGQLVLKTEKTDEINVSALKSGQYFIEAMNEEGEIARIKFQKR